MKQHNGMRPHDIVVLLKILCRNNWLNKDLANELYISPSEISESLNRSRIAGLIDSKKRNVFKQNLLDFIEHGLKYVFPVELGSIQKGIPTAHSAPSLAETIQSTEAYVWPSLNGTVRGQMIPPLYPNQVQAVQKDNKLYELLTLCDAVRVGRVREKQLAIEKIAKILDLEYAC